jgi:hypothetical protein
MMSTNQMDERQNSLLKTGELLAFPMAGNDDLDDNLSDDDKQDSFLAGLMHVATKPNASLMK